MRGISEERPCFRRGDFAVDDASLRATVRLGAPDGGEARVLAVGQSALYGFSLLSLTNVDTPYVRFEYGVPELGANPNLANLPYLAFGTNLRGTTAVLFGTASATGFSVIDDNTVEATARVLERYAGKEFVSISGLRNATSAAS